MNLKPFVIACTLMISNAYADNQGPATGAIYGVDDREFISNNTVTSIKEMATGISFIVGQDYIYKNTNNVSTILARALSVTANLCSSENRAQDLSITNCTGFLVSEDTVVTAGHCIKDEYDCRDKKFVFGVNRAKTTDEGFNVDDYNIYSCKSLVQRQENGNMDYAVIKLNRKVKARHIFKLSSEEVVRGSNVFMLGHPVGQALTYSLPAKVNFTSDAMIFGVPLDSFSGNSGSPVINAATNEVQGILISGNEDFIQDGSGCNKYATYSENRGESVLRIKYVKHLIK